ncbi:hypothetical protein [Pontibacter sp. SGAir0037]|uniref:hypothetical protein n=1 Tax=Pontibacter sp. SGAir0037 TaxID=2571030 RepID=UPI0010CD4F62|nr:hypothetical protein [Pontibacter sp. SGAir0037]QCR24100.1 hypothetical protein C1N53_18220 [Pontibacter sp. SGAir0037]
MKKALLPFIVLTALLTTASCSRNRLEVVSVEVPAGSDFSFCLNQPVQPDARNQFYYSIYLVTKDNFRYTRDGILADSSSCYSQSKFQYSDAAYTEGSMGAIRNISTSNLDTCLIQIYKDSGLAEEDVITRKLFTAEDFK